MKMLMTVVMTLLISALAGLGLVYAGAFGVAADEPHGALMSKLLETARKRGVERGAEGVAVPADLADAKRIASGAGEYAEMCASCHLAPGVKETELRAGLNPRPPDFSAAIHGTPAEQFWIVKHGIRMTAMPAWGLTHDDERLWSMVAFLQKLPGLSESDYRALVDAGEGGHHHDDVDSKESGEHTHEHASETKAPAAIAALPGEAAAAAAVIDDFQARLKQGDTKRAAQLLDPAVLIFEGGNAEKSRAEYASHHLGADAEFLAKATVRPLLRTGAAQGDLAWIATESEITSKSAQPLSLISTETMVLRKTAAGWRVTHIHWSSREKK
jgi:mono/diheme cytochrome c family protein/ketosteroid isomerase-like protein